MSTTHPVDEVTTYVAAVRDRLDDLPEEERAELLDDVATHVREVADEHGADHLYDRLGSPLQFADELRASAGYSPIDLSARADRGRRWRQLFRLADVVPVDRIAPVWARLEPTWWLVRGVLVAYVVLTGVGSTRREFVPGVGGTKLLGLLVLIGAAAVSYSLGERRSKIPRRARRVRVLGEIALVIFGVFYVAQASHSNVQFVTVDQGAPTQDALLRDSAGRAIGNLYAFGPAGQLIPQFFLVDQAGRPIDNLCPEQTPTNDPNGPPQTSYAHDQNGAPVYNVFPRAQQRVTQADPQTGAPTQTAPVPPPAVVFPQVAAATPDAASVTTTTVAPPAP